MQFIMICRLVSELLIKHTIGGSEGDILEYVKAGTQFSGMYWHLFAPRKLAEPGSSLGS